MVEGKQVVKVKAHYCVAAVLAARCARHSPFTSTVLVGGEWYVGLFPEAPTSSEGVVERPTLVIHLRETTVFCRMLTSRINLPLALLRGEIRLSGNLHIFLRMDRLFSVDAKP